MEREKWMFFQILRLARTMKFFGMPKDKRWRYLFWYRHGLFDGTVLYERG